MVEFTGFNPAIGLRLAHEVAPLPRQVVPNAVPATVGADRVGADLPGQNGSATTGGGAGGKDAGGGQGGGLGGGGHGAAQAAAQTGSPAVAQAALQARSTEPLKADTVTGPPPSFDTSPLDLETDLRLTLVRLQSGGYGQAPTQPAENAAVRNLAWGSSQSSSPGSSQGPAPEAAETAPTGGATAMMDSKPPMAQAEQMPSSQATAPGQSAEVRATPQAGRGAA